MIEKLINEPAFLAWAAIFLGILTGALIIDHSRREAKYGRRPAEIPEPPHGDMPFPPREIEPRMCPAAFISSGYRGLRCGLLEGHAGSHHDAFHDLDFMTRGELARVEFHGSAAEKAKGRS